MKGNIKSSIHNLFNKKARPSHEEIIKSIETIYHLECIDDTFKLDDMMLTIEHFDYFISSEADMEAFAEKVYAVGDRIYMYFKENPDNNWLALWQFNDVLLKLVKQFFDEEYFKKRAANSIS
jgi:hypothetical protein